MGFPAKTVDGKTVNIVEKGNQGSVELLRADNGDCYTASPTNPRILIPHEGNATEEKLLEAAQTQEGEKTIEVETPEGEKLITPIEQFESLINESADRKAAEEDETAEAAVTGILTGAFPAEEALTLADEAFGAGEGEAGAAPEIASEVVGLEDEGDLAVSA